MYFAYFQNLSIKVPLKSEKYINILGMFGETISKCPDIIRKNTTLLAHSLYSSLSIELKLLGHPVKNLWVKLYQRHMTGSSQPQHFFAAGCLFAYFAITVIFYPVIKTL